MTLNLYLGRDIKMQWNPSITDTFGEQCFGLFTEMAFLQRWPLLRGCFVHKQFIWDLGAWPLYSSWPLFGDGCRGSTVIVIAAVATFRGQKIT